MQKKIMKQLTGKQKSIKCTKNLYYYHLMSKNLMTKNKFKHIRLSLRSHP